MKSVYTILAVFFLVMGVAFGEEDGMEFGLRKIKGRKKVPKTYHTKLATRKDLGKKLNLKAKSIAKAKTKKKSKKYKELNDMFANVEYNAPKRKRPTKEEVFTELTDLSDLDQVDKYENKFVKAEGKRAKARRKKEVRKESQDSFVAVNTGKTNAKDNSFASQAGGSNLRGKGKKGVVAGSVAGTTFDNYDHANDEPVKSSVATINPPPPMPESTQKYSYTYESKAKSPSWISLSPVGGYGVISITGGQDIFNRGAKDWEASDSFLGGVMADLGRGRWQFESGLLYVRTGIKREVNNSMFGFGDNYMEFIDRDYVVIPLVGVYNFMERFTANASNIYAKAGLWPMYLTSAKVEKFSSNPASDFSGDASAFQSSWDTLAIIGAGGRIKISNSMAIVIEGYYLRGLSDSFNMNGMSGNTQGFVGNAGLSFDL